MACNFAAGLLVIVLVAPITVYGATHNVEWDQFTNYSSWALKSVKVGDTMVFVYDAPIHSLLVVSKAAYVDCDTSNPSFNDSTGHTTYKLKKEGPVYFICGTEVFCPGMQLQLNVKSASTSSSGGSPSSSPAATSLSTATNSTGSSKNGVPGHGLNWLVCRVPLVLGTLVALVSQARGGTILSVHHQ